jgi:hypothetical protein
MESVHERCADSQKKLNAPRWITLTREWPSPPMIAVIKDQRSITAAISGARVFVAARSTNTSTACP